MPYHHVIAKTASSDEFRALFSDLSADALQERFITPYERGTSFFSGNDLISPSDLRSVQIVRTQQLDQIERDEINRIDRAKIDEINSSSDGVFFLSIGGGYEPQDIAQAGEDVTHTFIKGPPGFKAGRWAPSMKAFGWIAGIVATVIAGGLAKWLGWV
jgi:hypothetical protein